MQEKGIGEQYHQKYKEWWSKRRHSEEPPSPTEVLLNCGIPWDLLGAALPQLVASASNDIKAPGIADYLIRNLLLSESTPKGSLPMYKSKESKYMMRTMIQKELTIDWFTQEDIETMMNYTLLAWDNGIPVEEAKEASQDDKISRPKRVYEGEANKKGCPPCPTNAHDFWNYVFHDCIAQTCNDETVLAILSRLPTLHQQCFTLPPWHGILDISCVSKIEAVIPKIKKLDVSATNLWTKDAYIAFLELLTRPSGPNLTLAMGLPHFVEYDKKSGRFKIIPNENGPCMLPWARPTSIKGFHLCARRHRKPLRAGSIEMLPRLHHLKALALHESDLSSFKTSSFIIETVANNKHSLKRIELVLSHLNEEDKKRILEAVLVNGLSSLQSLSCDARRHSHGGPIPTLTRKMLERTCAGVLENNPRLTDLRLAGYRWDRHADHPSVDESKMKYYLALNKCGRAQASDFSTTYEEYVSFLCRALDYPLFTCKIQFELLLASPGIWSSTGPSTSHRKRKATD